MHKQLLLAVVLTAPLSSYADNCSYSKDLSFSVQASALSGLQMDIGAGNLVIEGDSASNEIRVEATACANSSRRLEELQLTHRVHDSELRVRTERHRGRGLLSWLSLGSNYSYIDLEVSMPSTLSLDIEDGSGGIEISNISRLMLKDGSGYITINGASGNVTIDDGSGSITVSRVRGTVSVDDGSGPILIRDSNQVAIVDDGSGEISIENILDSVHIHNDGSGGIRISDVAGNVEIDDAGSGSVDVRGIAGNYSNHDD